MNDDIVLVPPRAPLLQPPQKKEGFFQNIFKKKEQDVPLDKPTDLSTDLPPLPAIPEGQTDIDTKLSELETLEKKLDQSLPKKEQKKKIQKQTPKPVLSDMPTLPPLPEMETTQQKAVKEKPQEMAREAVLEKAERKAKEESKKFSHPYPEEHPSKNKDNVLFHPLPEVPTAEKKEKRGFWAWLFSKKAQPKEEGNVPEIPDAELTNLPPLPAFDMQEPETKLIIPEQLPEDEVDTAVDEAIEQYFNDVEAEKEMVRKELERIMTGKKRSSTFLTKNTKRLDQLMKNISKINSKKFALRFQGKEGKVNKREFLQFIKQLDQTERELASLRDEVFDLIMDNVHEEAYGDVHDMIQEKKEELSEQHNDIKEKQAYVDEKLPQLEKREQKLDEREQRLTLRENDVKEREKMVTDLVREKVELLVQKRMVQEERRIQKIKDDLEKEKIQLAMEKTKLESSMKDLQEKEHHLEEENAEYVQRMKDLEDSLAKMKADYELKLKVANDQAAQLGEQLKAVNVSKDAVRRSPKPEKDFQGYLQESLRQIQPASMKQEPLPEPQQTEKIYQLIDQCKDCIGQGDVYNAQKAYNDAKSAFYTCNVHGTEKAILYNTLRELYDDIRLLLLDQD
ncbi:MAG: hypothetical protein V1725_00380 [archaeon]